MPTIVTYLLLIFLGLYGITSIIAFAITKNAKIFIIEILSLFLVIATLNLTLDFPLAKQSFGGFSPLAAIGIMFFCIILGMASHYFFYRKGKFSWHSFLKPFFVSPIVLLPLLGTLQRTSNLEPIQLISFSILSFQNGFFWRVIYEISKKQYLRSSSL